MTAETASQLVNSINTVLGDSNPEDQTADNLKIVTQVLRDVAGLLNEGNFSVDKNVR